MRIPEARPAESSGDAGALFACSIVIASMALGIAATDIFLPSVPTIQADLHASGTGLKLAISAFFAAYGLAQIVLGPLSDRWGRYRLLVGCQLLFLLSTSACALAWSAGSLGAMRTLQGVGACAAGVVGRGVITDVLRPRRAAHVLTIMQAVKSIAPATAPVLGAFIAAAYGWRWSFWFIALLSGLVMLAMIAFLKETIQERRPSLGVRQVKRDFLEMLRTPEFAGPITISTLLYASMIGFLLSAPFLMCNVFFLSQKTFAVIQALHTVGFVIGVFVAGLMVGRFQPKHTLLIGTGACLLVLMAFLAASLRGIGLVGFCSATILHIFCSGLTIPSANVSALMLFRDRAGTAASLQGGVFYVGSAIAAVAISSLVHATPIQVLLGMAAPSLLAFLVAVGGLKSTLRFDLSEVGGRREVPSEPQVSCE